MKGIRKAKPAKPPKSLRVLYRVHGPERTALERKRQVVAATLGEFRQLVAFIAERERIPMPAFFDDERLVFTVPPAREVAPDPALSEKTAVRLNRAARRRAAKVLRKGGS